MTDLYRDHILDHYHHPRHWGHLDRPTLTVAGANRSCGDELTFDLEIKGDSLTAISFTARACAVATASASILTEKVIGQKLAAIDQLTEDEVVGWLGLPLSPVRRKCALLPLWTLKDREKAPDSTAARAGD